MHIEIMNTHKYVTTIIKEIETINSIFEERERGCAVEREGKVI